jgi:hypothetical protein
LKDSDFHKEAVEAYEADWNADRDNRRDAAEDLRFMGGDQWEPGLREARQALGRPVLTINRTGQFVRQVTGDMRQNRPSIRVFPVDGETDRDMAAIYEGIIRHIEHKNRATHVYSYAGSCQAACGIGHFRIGTAYCQDDPFAQEITIDRIINPLAVVWDSGAVKLDRSDAMRCFVWEDMPTAAFKKKYPDAIVQEWSTSRDHEAQSGLYWFRQDTVRLCEYWWKEETEKQYALLGDHVVIDVTGWKPFDVRLLGPKDVRKVKGFKVRQALMSGAEILTGPNEWAGQHIPIVPVIGEEVPLAERIIRHGVIRHLKDPQRLYNLWRSSGAELVGQAPRAPYLVTAKMVAANKPLWDRSANSPAPYLLYEPDPLAPGGKPERMAPPQAPAAMWQEAAVAAEDMKSVTGIYDAALGARSNETSGKAILARQQEGDTGTFVYHDNLQFAVGRGGQIVADLIPRIYDNERIMRIIGPEDEEHYIPVNRMIQSPNGPLMINDLTSAKVDIRIESGPSYTTKRRESADMMMQFIQAIPGAGQFIGDLVAKNMDWPGADKIAARLQKLLPPGMADEDTPPPVSGIPKPQPGQQAPGQEAMQPGQGEAPVDPAMAMAAAGAEEQMKQLQAKTIEAEAKAKQAAVNAQIMEVKLANEVASARQNEISGRVETVEKVAEAGGAASEAIMQSLEGVAMSLQGIAALLSEQRAEQEKPKAFQFQYDANGNIIGAVEEVA